MPTQNIKKYHISIFTTNILALILAIFFIRSYRLREIPVLPVFLVVLVVLLVFILAAFFILKPSGKIKNIFPGKSFIILNMSIALIFCLIFFTQIGFLGFLFALLFAFFLFEAEHLLYEGVKR